MDLAGYGLTLVRVLVVNAGSSSLKLRLLDQHDTVLHTADIPAGASGFDLERLDAVLKDWGDPDGVAHRVVHGGTSFTSAVRIGSPWSRSPRIRKTAARESPPTRA